MDLKKELLLGILGSVLIVILVVYFITSYPKPQVEPKNNQPISKILTKQTVAQHNQANDCWVIIEKSVYDVTEFLSVHPGGAEAITPYCGTDASKAFANRGEKGPHPDTAREKLKTLKIGQL